MTPGAYMDMRCAQSTGPLALGNLVFALHRQFHVTPFAAQFPEATNLDGPDPRLGWVLRIFTETEEDLARLTKDVLVLRMLGNFFETSASRVVRPARIIGYAKTYRVRDAFSTQRLKTKLAKGSLGVAKLVREATETGRSFESIQADLKRTHPAAHLRIRSNSGHTGYVGIGVTESALDNPPDAAAIGGRFSCYGLSNKAAEDGWLPVLPLQI